MFENLRELEKLEGISISDNGKKEFIIAAPERAMSVAEIENKIDKYKPNLVVIDGVYLLKDSRTKTSGLDWKVLGNVSTDLKNLAKDKRVPIVGVHQANRKGDEEADDLSDVAFTDMYARDADVLIKCIHFNSFSHGNVVALLFSGAREFKMAGFYVEAKPATSFDYITSFETKEELLAAIKRSKENHNKASASMAKKATDVAKIMGRDSYKNSGKRYSGSS